MQHLRMLRSERCIQTSSRARILLRNPPTGSNRTSTLETDLSATTFPTLWEYRSDRSQFQDRTSRSTQQWRTNSSLIFDGNSTLQNPAALRPPLPNLLHHPRANHPATQQMGQANPKAHAMNISKPTVDRTASGEGGDQFVCLDRAHLAE